MANQWYPFFPGDYARDTGHLSDFEDLCYRRLLDYYYSTGEPLPFDEERLKRVCKAFSQEQQGAVVYVLGAFFKESSEGFRNDKADRVIAKAAEVSEKRAEAARKSHERRGKPPEPPKPAIAPIKPAIAPKNDANGGAKTVHPQPQPQEPLQDTTKGNPVHKIDALIREEIERRRPFIRARFSFTDADIEIELEEILIKCRTRSPGPDIWLYLSKWFKNRRDEIDSREKTRQEKQGTRAGREPRGADHERTLPPRDSNLDNFVDKSDNW